MRVSLIHHRYRAFPIGFKPAFLIYDDPPEGPTEALAPSANPKNQQIQPEVIPGHLHKNTELAKALETAKLRYNGLRLDNNILAIEYLDAEQNYINISGTLANIDKLLVTAKEKDKVNLMIIKSKLQSLTNNGGKDSQEVTGQREAADPGQVKFYGDRLITLDQNLAQAKETNKTWPSTEIHQKITAFYETSLGMPQFKALRTDVNGQFDQHRENENKALFLTLMAKETENFTKLPSLAEEVPAIENLDDPAFLNNIQANLIAFQEAINKVDQQGGEGNLGEIFHPSIRRLMIEQFYLDEFGESEDEDTKAGDNWLFVQLSQAPYFRAEVPGGETGNAQRVALAVAFAGRRAANALDSQEELVKTIEELKDEPGEEEAKAIADYVSKELPSDQSPKDFIEQEKQTANAKIENYRKFLTVVEEIIQKPFEQDGRPNAFLEKLHEEGDGGLGFIQRGDLYEFNISAQRTEVSYSMAQLGGKVEEGGFFATFEKMGMDLKNTHDLYMEAIVKDPTLTIENWDEMLDKDPNKMADLLQGIVRPSLHENEQQGRKAFLVTLRSMKQPSSDPTAIQIMRNRVSEIKRVIEKGNEIRRDDTDAASIILKEAMKQPPSVKDMIMGPISKLTDMVWSGDYFDKLVAGGILVAAATLIIKGFKNMDKWWGKLVAGGVGVTAIAAAYEAFTDDKVLRYAKKMLPDDLEKAAEKTPEMVLVNHGQKEMEDLPSKGKEVVNRHQNLRGLLALRKVPFKKVREWNKAYKGEGGPYSAQKEARLFKEMGINLKDVVDDKGLKTPERERQVKHILNESINRQYEFVAKQREKPVDKTDDILDEVYVKSVEIQNYTAQERDIVMQPGIYREFHGRQDRLTFGEVIRREVNPFLVEKALMADRYGIVTPLVDKSKALASDVSDSFDAAAILRAKAEAALEAEKQNS